MGFDGEQYERDGKFYDRVTKVINYFVPPELAEYRARVGNAVANRSMKSAGKFGTMIDEAIRDYWKSPAVKKVTPESKNALSAWNSWVRDYSPTELEFPETMFNDSLLVAGTPDFKVGKMIVDIKCSSRVSPLYFAQLGAYAFLSGKETEDLAVLRLDKVTGMYEFVKASAMGLTVGDCINYFSAHLITYRNYKQVQSTLKGQGVCNESDSECW